MSDNTGDYITYDELLSELYISDSTLVTSSDITLSNKTVDVDGDIYEYSMASGTPLINDVIFQSGESDIIKEILITPDRIKIEKTDLENNIVNGSAKLLHSDKVYKKRGESLIHESMDFIDQKTKQFFNSRTGTFEIQGNNTPVLFFNVPIIEITKLLINNTDTELIEGPDYDFVAFKGRTPPQDDRRNPHLQLNFGKTRNSIYTGIMTNKVFYKNAYSIIEGSFGFLEADGSTPSLIKKATMLLTLNAVNNNLNSVVSSNTGPLKRRKVDLHEEEFFELKGQTSVNTLSGISEVDRIIAMYRSPILIGGSSPDIKFYDRRNLNYV